MSVSNNDCVLVELRPFAHQVGGHTCVLELNSSTICKPFASKEVWFYENEPDEMKEFTPRYLGEVDVECDMASSSKCLLACLPCSVAKERGLVTFEPPNLVKSVSKKSRKRTFDLANSLIYSRSKVSQCDSSEDSIIRSDQCGLDVWSVQCIERQINRYGFWANNQPQKFIMLENLVGKYKKPCMMDLKMGRRQYGEDSSTEKRKLLQERCANSTSSSLGFRICGTQVYQESTQTYIVHNKYYGRDLTVEGVRNELQFFFSNGVCLRRDAIHLILTKLQRLKTLLETQKTFNFFACSLLLMYDGEVSEDKKGACSFPESTIGKEIYSGHVIEELNKGHNAGRSENVDVRLIDFAHACKRSTENFKNCSDEGILFGLEKLISNLTSVLEINQDDMVRE